MMIKTIRRTYAFFIVLWVMVLGNASVAHSQALKINIDSTSSMTFGFNLQTWASIDLQTSGTRFTNSSTQGGNWEMMIRRARVSILTVLAKDNIILFHMGVNNIRFNALTSTLPNIPINIHDLSYQRRFAVASDVEIHLGTGIHYFHGPSRFASASSGSITGFDLISYTDPLGDLENVSRSIGIFSAGSLGPINYRLALDQPFISPSAVNSLTTTTATSKAILNASWVSKEVEGYIYYQLFDKEKPTTASGMGGAASLGAKKLNIGFGGMWVGQNTFTKTGTTAGTGITLYDTWGISGDIYADIPFGEKDALGGLCSYFNYSYYNFGPNYAKVLGTDNSLMVTGHHLAANLLFYTGKLLPINLGVFAEVVAVAADNGFNANAFWTRYDVGLSWFAMKQNIRINLVYRNASAETDANISTKVVDFGVRRDRMIFGVMVGL